MPLGLHIFTGHKEAKGKDGKEGKEPKSPKEVKPPKSPKEPKPPKEKKEPKSDDHTPNRKKEYVFESTPIGFGGYSKVLKAKWKPMDNQLIAMKVVRKESVKNREEYLKIVCVGFPRVLGHPNICAGIDWFETPSKFYVTFPLLTGGELLTRLNTRGRFTEDAVKRVMRVILSTLAYIHSHGIIHRDIKPDNWLYRTPESEVDDLLLIDFGISKILDTQGEEDVRDQYEAGGTPGYAAPEVFCGMGYGKNSDLFGAGVITYNLLSSWSPWESRDIINLIQETAHANLNFPEGPFEGVSEGAKSFVRCLMQPPARRPSANKALQHPWLSDIPAVDQAHVEDSSEANADILHPHPTIKPHHPIAKQLTARPAAD